MATDRHSEWHGCGWDLPHTRRTAWTETRSNAGATMTALHCGTAGVGGYKSKASPPGRAAPLYVHYLTITHTQPEETWLG